MSDYEIRPGDTLSKIAKKYGVTVKQLQEANGIKNPNLIFAGNNLKIPIEQDEAFDIPGLTINKNPKDSDYKPLYGIVTPSGSGTVLPKNKVPTVPTGEVRALYAAITPSEPSDSDTPKILPSDIGKAVPLYGIPTPSAKKDGTPLPTGDVRTLYALITPSEPSDVAKPLYAHPVPTVPSGEVRTVYGIPTPTKISMQPLYAIQTPLEPGKSPSTIVLPTVPPVKIPVPKTPDKSKALTETEKKAADTAGKNTAHYLAGYTMDVEQEAIVNNVNKVNNRNVLEFLQSYTNHRNDEIVHAEPFFTQVIKEYGFDEKQDVMHKVALRLAAKLANDGYKADAAKIKNILKHVEFTKQDAKSLDAIYSKYMQK